MYFQPTSAFFSRQLSWFPKQKSPDIQNKQIQPKLALLARHWSSRKLQPQQTIFFRFSASPPTKLPPPPGSLTVRPVKIGNPNCGNSSEATIHQALDRQARSQVPVHPVALAVKKGTENPSKLGWVGRDPREALGAPRFCSKATILVKMVVRSWILVQIAMIENLGKHTHEWSLKRRWLYQ